MSGKFVNYESLKSDQQTWRTLLSNNQGARIKQKVLKNEIKKIKTVRYVESGSSSLFNQCLVVHDCINSAILCRCLVSGMLNHHHNFDGFSCLSDRINYGLY